MEQLNAILGTLSYVPAVLVGVFVACGRAERKRYYYLRALLVCLIICVLRHTIIQQVRAASFASQGITTLANSSVSVMTCVLCTLSVWFCYQKQSGWQLLYYGITGFCLQFITHKLYELLQIFFTFIKPVETAIVVGITAVGYLIAWKKLFSKLDTETMAQRRSMQIAIAVICIYINFFVRLDIFSSSVAVKLAVWFLSVAAMASILLL